MTATLFYSCHSHADVEGTHSHDEADSYADSHEHGIDEIVFTPEQASRAGLEVTALTPSDFSEVIEVSGQVLPAQGAEATVTATMSGIVRLSGQTLTAGAPVGVHKPLFYIHAAALADGNPAATAQAELEAARTAWERAERLAAEQIVSQRELEEVRRRYETAQSTARSLGDQHRVRPIHAPLKGYIKDLQVKNGDYVTVGQPLATVTQDRRLQLRADVPERYYTFLQQVRSARFRMAYAGPGEVHDLEALNGRLVSRGQVAQTGDFFVPVTFEFNNQGHLVPGAFAQVYLLGQVRSGVLAVPVEAIAEGQGLHFVYQQLNDHTYRRQQVKLGMTDGNCVEILAGLHAGDRIVTRGTTQVKLAANASVAPEGHKH